MNHLILSQSDKSSDSSNESASFEWESLTQNLECGQQAITAPRTKIRIRRKVKWQLEMKFRQLSVLGSQSLRTDGPKHGLVVVALCDLLKWSSEWKVQTRAPWTMQSGFIPTECTNSIGRAVNIDLVTCLWTSSFGHHIWWHHVVDIMFRTSLCWHHIVDIILYDITLLTSNHMTSYLGSILEQLPISYGPWGMPLRIAHQAYQIARGLPIGYLPMSHMRFSMEVIHGRFGPTKKASDAPQFDMISLSWSNSSTAFRNLAWTGSHEMVQMIGSYDMIHMIWFIW